MLQRLFIQNYAIIDEVTINWQAGFSVITGETGAGKSILMGALGLILGERADTTVLVQKEKKLVVEGVFAVADDVRVQQFLVAQDLEIDTQVVLRREISPQGKSRAFINDTPVNLLQLQTLSSLLVDLHQQFDTLQLGQENFQREVLDALAGQLSVVQEYNGLYQAWLRSNTQLQQLQEQKNVVEAQAAFHRFQWEELEAAAFTAQEVETLEAELKLLTHAEEMQQVFATIAVFLSEGEEPVVARLKSLLNALAPFREMHASFPALEDRLRTSYVELQDLSREFDKLSTAFAVDPQRSAWVSDRLSLGYKLFKKHQVNSTQALIEKQENLAQQLQHVVNLDQQLVQQQKEVAQLEKKATLLAQQISIARQKQTGGLVKKVHQLLHRVGMPAAALQVKLETGPLGPYGVDVIEFLFDANNSGQFHPLRKVASGGELSRLMLCIKSLVADSSQFSTQLFDEIDTGIGGEAARQVGLLLQEFATSRQVICITHQPQIAGKANTHFFVYKEKTAHKTGSVQTAIRQLEQDERVQIIAQMIGGENPTAAALANARELLS
jgi:DNA repair protein RecN (Recombination protein N)